MGEDLFDRELTDFLSHASTETCEKVMYDIFHNSVYVNGIDIILSKIFSVRSFKKKVLELYNSNKDILQKVDWEDIILPKMLKGLFRF